MAKIYSPNKNYTGVSASVSFLKGVGETQDEHLKDWFKNHGYRVEDEVPADSPKGQEDKGEKTVENMTVDELKAYAEGNGIDLTGLTKKDDILNKIKAGK